MHRTIEEIQTRLSAIATELETATGDALTALENETNTLLEERRQIEEEATRRQQLRESVANGTAGATTVEIARSMPTGNPIPAPAAAPAAEQRGGSAPVELIPGVTEAEVRSFAGFIRGSVTQMRTGEQNFNLGNNGVLLPVSIARRVIDTVRDICPIFAGAEIYRVKGTLKIPTYGKANGTHDITVAYANEFTELTADAGAFGSIDLSGYLIGALTLIGQSLLNNSDIDLASFVIRKMADKIAAFFENEFLNGDGSNHCTGALSTTNTMKAGSASAISSDNLIDLQAKVKQAFQANAVWTMHSDTFTAIKKLKDGNGRYLIQDDITGEFPYRLLGKPVYLSDNMPKIGAGKKPVLYGDYSGLGVNMREDMSLQVLREKYATQHAIGIVAWMELDSKVIDSQKLATLETSAS